MDGEAFLRLFIRDYSAGWDDKIFEDALTTALRFPVLYTFYNHIGNDHTLFTQYSIYQMQARPPEKHTNEPA